MKRDYRDHFVMALIALILLAGTAYLFKWHSDLNFVTWAGLVATITGAFHYLNIRDDKEKDQC